MAKKIVSVCDRCQDTGVEEPAEIENISVVVNGVEYRLDLCTNCDLNWWGPFANSVQSFGIPAGKAAKVEIPKSEKPYPCEIDGCPAGYTSTGGRSEHYWTKHPDVAHKYVKAKGGIKTCRVKGCEAKVRGNVGEAQHMRQRHPEVWAEVKEREQQEQAPQLALAQ